jgi:signal recognition particle receptor subunit beta
MVQFNFSERTIKAKVVYYGPPQSGKTTNLEQIHRLTDPEGANRLISLNTAQDRTLFFDLLPFSLGTVSGYDFKIQLYTVPGQVQYNATRRVVLAGADAVVFVADGQKAMARENLTAFENMRVNLLANRLVPEKVPLVLQYNKQDLELLVPRAELDRTLNPWGRKAFPAVASRGEGVLETFVAVVQEMLAAIALKYNLKEKGLDPAAVPEVVSQAFAAIVRAAPSPPPVAAPAAPAAVLPPPVPPRVVISQPESAEPAYPGQVGPEVSPVSEELLHRAIRSNVDLAEALGQVVRDLDLGLGTIQTQAAQLASPADERQRAAAVAGIQAEVRRLQALLRGVGHAAAAHRAGAVRAPAPPQVAPTPPRGTTTATPAVRPPAPPPLMPLPGARPPGAASPPLAPARPVATPVPVPVPPPAPPRPPAASPPAAATLDALVAEVLAAVRPTLTRPVTFESRVARGTAVPRCSPASVRGATAALVRGLAAAVTPATAVLIRAERKPVLLRAHDGSEVKRDFMMLAFTHAAGVGEADQQRVLKGADPGPLGEASRLVREMRGFMRFAPLPGGAMETRVFLPT